MSRDSDILEDIQIGAVCFSPDQKLLTGPNGTITLEDKMSDLLNLLTKRRGETVSKEDILTHVWNGRMLSEQTVPVAISKLRKALREAGEAEGLLDTIPKRGYLLKSGEKSVADIPKKPSARLWTLGGIATALLLIAFIWPFAIPKVSPGKLEKPGLILTVNDIRTQKEDDTSLQRVIALSELMSYYLSQVPEVLVIRHWWKLDAPDPTGGIFTRYGENTPVYLLTGTLIDEGDEQLVTLFLSKPKTEEIIWSGVHEVKAGAKGYFGLLAEMFMRLDIDAKTPTPNALPSDDRYWAGRYYMNLSNENAAKYAATLFEGIQDDGKEKGDAVKALTALNARWTEISAPTGQPDFKEDGDYTHLVDKAVVAFFKNKDAVKAMSLLDIALSVAPGDHYALSLKAEILASIGKTEEALAVYRKAARLAPFAKAYRARIIELEGN